MVWRPELIFALIGRAIEYLAYGAIIYGFAQIYSPLGWIVGGVLVLQAAMRRPE